jgi:hypothetical protein
MRATAAAAIAAKVVQPAIFSILPFTRSPIILRSFEILRIRIEEGRREKAVDDGGPEQCSKGLIPAKLISIPSNVEMVIRP